MKAELKKWLRILLVAYLCLLVASHLKRILDPIEIEPGEAQKIFVADGYGEDAEQPIEIAYLDEGPRDGPVLLLIHGSPVGSSVFDPLIEALPENFRIVAPDLPGHGNSTHLVKDGSFRADADYLHQLIERLDLQAVHLIAYSRGGGPALILMENHPEEVSSLVLLSSIGVQEQELLGNHSLNQALFSLQYGFFLLLEELVPHFGFLDNSILNTDYAQSFSDADQRPLRGILSRIEAPTLILHGENDALVPLAAAEEHQRIVPHSELKTLSGGHIVLMKKAGIVADHISNFVHKTEAGLATVKSQASPARLLAAAQAKAENPGAPASGRGLVFLVVILVLATFVSEDLTCVVAGVLAAAGTISFPIACLACFLGIFIGDLTIFFMGRIFGAKAIHHAPFRWVITESRLDMASTWFDRRGAVVILATRFIPGSRLPAYFAAGMARIKTAKFIFYFVVASAIWTPLLVGLSMLLGNQLLNFLSTFEHWALPGLLGLILIFFAITHLIVPAFSHRGRRILYGRWRRKVRWEFWPRWVFYPPVVLWVIWLGLRYRHPSLFTGVNPSMEGGGIAFESKREIYEQLAKGQGSIVRTLALDPEQSIPEWLGFVRSFQKDLKQPYPLVCKPDQGERGEGVTIVQNEKELEAALKDLEGTPLVQEFIPGLEFGVFFEKKPSESQGRITSITRKIHTSVVGDGLQTIDSLILNHERAVCSYPFFREKYKEQLLSIPAEGEVFELAPLGTHCRGSIFLDGSNLASAELDASINRIFDGAEGLCFGRLDAKCPSEEEFQEGKNITLIEFNGITSEPTHIYDAKYSLWFAYRTVFAQWNRAFAIAEENKKNGHPPWTATQTLRRLFAALFR